MARCGFGEVGDVVNHRLGTVKFGLLNEVAHPGAAALVVTLKEIGVEQRQRLAVFIKYLVYPHVRMINRDIFALFKADAVQQIGCVEYAVMQHVVHLKVRLDL
ncbi:hypothetical protein D3C79_380240 [compost metagenome]